MSTTTPTYSMDDLVAQTGVTVRTVRYYISEGLLPPPEGAGPATTYRDIHLNRLRLIGLLKDAYLPLKEIRRRLAAMTDEEIAAAVDPQQGSGSGDPQIRQERSPNLRRYMRAPMDEPSHKPPTSRRPDVTDSAASYIDRVLNQPSSMQKGELNQPNLPSPLPIGRVDLPGQFPPDVTWRRLSIAPEAELLISDDAYRRRRDQIDAALDWIRRILNNA
jgi:DNA-binding transcriptional MerR regulator